MKILKLLDSHDTGGIFTCECQYIKELNKRGHQVDGIIIGDGKNFDIYKQLLSTSIHIQEEYKYKKFRDLQSILFAKNYSKQLIDKHIKAVKKEYDAIFYRRPTFLYMGGILGKKLDTDVYWHMPKSMENFIQKWIYNWMLRMNQIIPIANSKYTCSTLGDYCQDFVYPGFDEEKFIESKPIYRNQLGIPLSEPVYGIAARLSPDKAADIVIQAFLESDKIQEINAHLLIAGGPLDTEYASHLKKLCGNKLNKNIHFMGYLDSMPEFYSSVDIVINGRRDAEPFGITIAEAMASGKPIIAYYLGGPSEMITHSENGWLVKNPDIKSYKNALELSIEKRSEWPVMSKKAKSKSVDFSSTTSVSKLLEIIS